VQQSTPPPPHTHKTPSCTVFDPETTDLNHRHAQVLNLEMVVATLKERLASKEPSKGAVGTSNPLTALKDTEVDYDNLEDITALRQRVAARDHEIASLRAELAEANAAARHAQVHARAAKTDAVKAVKEHMHALRETQAECERLKKEVDRLTHRLLGGQADGQGSLRDEIAAQVREHSLKLTGLGWAGEGYE
jgi:chromosome segregation ATPase